MKMKKIEKWLLLEASGELSPRQLRRLERELAVSEDARILRGDLGRFRGSVLRQEIEPSPWAAAKIAARLREEHHPARTVTRGLKPALALAACLALVAGVLIFHGKKTSLASIAVVAAADVWNDSLEEDMSRLEGQIMAISGDSFDIMEM